jgi:hypothetical protein
MSRKSGIFPALAYKVYQAFSLTRRLRTSQSHTYTKIMAQSLYPNFHINPENRILTPLAAVPPQHRRPIVISRPSGAVKGMLHTLAPSR